MATRQGSRRRKGPTPRRRPAVGDGPRDRRGTARRWLVRGAIGLVVLVLLAVAVDGVRLWRGVDRVDLALPGAGGGATNYLLVGSDSRAFATSDRDRESFGSASSVPGQRADLLVLVHVPASGPPVILRIPRDLVVDFPGQGAHRITLALTRGPQLLVDTLCSALGLGVDHLVVLDFEGFRKLVDVVGGIDVDVPAPLRDPLTGLDLPTAGSQHLDGDQALALVRTRHTEELVDGTWRPVADGAGERLDHAQQVLEALAPPVRDRSRSWWGLHGLLGAVAGSVTTDAGSGRGQADQLAAALDGLGGASGQVQQIPAVFHDGEVPTAQIKPEAATVLRATGAGANPRCPTKPIPPVPGEADASGRGGPVPSPGATGGPTGSVPGGPVAGPAVPGLVPPTTVVVTPDDRH